MESECFGLYWEGIADSDCTRGKGCSKLAECLEKFTTTTLAQYQRELGPKKATPENLSGKTAVQPEAILLALNHQKDQGFNPFLVVDEPRKITRNVVEYAGQDASIEEPEFEEPEFEEPEFEEPEFEEPEVKEPEVEVAPKKTRKPRRVKKKKPVSEVTTGAQFCGACRGTGKRGRGNCKACQGSGMADVAAERTDPAAVATRAPKEPVDSAPTAGDVAEAVVEGGNPRSGGASGLLPVQGGDVPDTVFTGSQDCGGASRAQTDRPPGKVSRGEAPSRDAQHGGVVGSPVLQATPINRGENMAKKQVVLDLYNKRAVQVDWPDYPTLMETPNERIVQLVSWDVARGGWTKLVPSLTGDPDEVLYGALSKC